METRSAPRRRPTSLHALALPLTSSATARLLFRGGYGWAFDDAEVSYYETTVFNNPPAVATYSVGDRHPSIALPVARLTALSTTPGRVQAVPVNYKTPYVQQYSLDIQQQITPDLHTRPWLLRRSRHPSAGCAGNQPAGSWRLGRVGAAINSGSACIDPDTDQQSFLNSTCDRVLNQIKPYLGYFAIDALRTIFSSNYNSLQAKVTKRFSRQDLYRRELYMVARPDECAGGLLGIHPEHL